MNIVTRTIGTCTVEVTLGDLTKEPVDAIVNAANSSLRGGGGVDGAIHRAGGPAILEECILLNGCETGDAKITTGGNLPASHVVHTVGPVYRGGQQGEAELLARCHIRSLQLAAEHALSTVAFPAISCGVYGYPIELAAPVAIGSVASAIREQPTLTLIRFVLFSLEVQGVFGAALRELSE